MTEKQKEANRKALHKLLDVVLDVNGFEARAREETGDMPTVFLRLSGHVALCMVEVHKTGWEKNASSDLGSDFYFDEPMKINSLINRLEKLKG